MTYNSITVTAEQKLTTKTIEFQHPITKAWVSGTRITENGRVLFRVVFIGIPAGLYGPGSLKFRLSGSSPEIIRSNTNEVRVENEPVIIVPPGEPYTLTPLTSDYQGNAGIAELQTGSGVVRRASLAMLKCEIENELSFTLKLKSNGGSRKVTLLLNGQLLRRIILNSGVELFEDIALPSLSKQQLTILLGRGDRDFELGDILAVDVVSLDFPGNGIAKFTKRATTTEAIIFTDSIGSGADASNESLAYVHLMRSDLFGAIANGYGSHTAYEAFYTEAARAKAMRAVDATFAGRDVQQIVDLALLTNDYDFKTAAPEVVVLGMAIFLDDVHKKYPLAKCFVQTPTPRYDKTGDQLIRNGFVLQDFRDAAAKLKVGREHFVAIIDGPTMLPLQSDLSTDKLHPNDNGHDKIAAYKKNFYATYVFAAQPSGPVLIPEPVEEVTPTYLGLPGDIPWDNIFSADNGYANYIPGRPALGIVNGRTKAPIVTNAVGNHKAYRFDRNNNTALQLEMSGNGTVDYYCIAALLRVKDYDMSSGRPQGMLANTLDAIAFWSLASGEDSHIQNRVVPTTIPTGTLVRYVGYVTAEIAAAIQLNGVGHAQKEPVAGQLRSLSGYTALAVGLYVGANDWALNADIVVLATAPGMLTETQALSVDDALAAIVVS